MAEETVPAAAGPSRRLSVPNLIMSLVFGVLGLATVVWATGGKIDLSAVGQVAPGFLLIALGLVTLDWTLEAVRLTLLCRALGERPRFLSILRICTSSMLVSRVTPFNAGGDPFQIYLLGETGVPLGRATAAIAVKSGLHGLARYTLGLTAPWLFAAAHGQWEASRQAQAATYFSIGIIAIVFIAGAIAFVQRARLAAAAARWVGKPAVAQWLSRPRVADARRKLIEQSRVFLESAGRFRQGHRRTLLLAWLLSLLGWSSIMLVPVALVRGFGGNAPPAVVAATAVIFYLAAAFGPTPGSAGASELAFGALFGAFVAPESTGAFVLVWRFFTHYLGMIVGSLMLVLSLGNQHQDDGRPVPAIDALGGTDYALPMLLGFGDSDGTRD